MRTIPGSGLMLFWGCVVGCAGLLRECAWTGVLAIGRWAAADWSCAILGSCQVVVLSRWLRTHGKSEHICICDITATWRMGSTRHTWPRTCSTCTTRCACASPNVTARATVAFDRRASWQAMCAREWNRLKPHRLQNPLERFLFACNWLVRAPVLRALFVFLLLLILILFSSLKGGLRKDSGKKTKGSAYKTCQSSAIAFIKNWQI